MSKKTPPGRAPRPLPDPKPASQAFMRGREFSSKFCLEFSHDELAEAIEGLREGILSHIRENAEKLASVTANLNRAADAIGV